MRYCNNCGSMNDTDAKFCSGCGKKFEYAASDNNSKTVPTETNNTIYTDIHEQPVYDTQSDTAQQQFQNNRAQTSTNGISSNKYNGYSMASLILGICSIVFSAIIPILPLAAAIVGLVLGKKAKIYGDNGKAKAGRITSVIGIILTAIQVVLIIIAVILLINVFTSNPGVINDIYENLYDLYNLR